MARNGPPSVAELLQRFQQGGNFTYKLDIEKGILEASDDADHARAMHALGRMEEARKRLGKPPRSKVTATPEPSGLTLEKAIQNYSEVEAPGLKMDTWDGRQRALKSFVDALCGKTLVSSITRPMAAEWASDLVRKGATKRTAVNYVSNVAQVFAFLRRSPEIE